MKHKTLQDFVPAERKMVPRRSNWPVRSNIVDIKLSKCRFSVWCIATAYVDVPEKPDEDQCGDQSDQDEGGAEHHRNSDHRAVFHGSHLRRLSGTGIITGYEFRIRTPFPEYVHRAPLVAGRDADVVPGSAVVPYPDGVGGCAVHVRGVLLP